MTGYKKNLAPQFNVETESSFITDFLPGIKNEDWKYTNIKKFIPDSIAVQPFNIGANTEKLKKVVSNKVGKLPQKNMVFFLDGVFQEKLSDLPAGIKIQKLNHSENKQTDLYLNCLGRAFNTKKSDTYGGFSSFLKNTSLIKLNAHLTDSPHMLSISDSYNCDKHLKIIHGFSNHDAFFNQSRLLYLIEKNAKALIHDEIINFGKEDSAFNMVSEFICLEGSSLDFFTTQNDLTNSSLINSVFCVQQKNSSSKFHFFSKKGKLIRNNVLVDLLDTQSSSSVLGTSLMKSSDHLDNFITISHLVEGCKSNQFFKSVYDENSSGAFCGKIYVEKGAQQTEAFQQNNNLMVSEKANVSAKPQLEIFADDVVCSHGCTIGAIDEDTLFYLRSRGIQKKEAVQLLIVAFLNELISGIKNPEIKKEVSKLFLNNTDV